MKIKKVIVSLLIIFNVFMPLYVYAEETVDNSYKANVTFKYYKDSQKEVSGVPEIGCKAAYIAEPETGKVIYEKNAHEKMYPASTTKLLTVLVALENCKLTDTATVSKRAIDLVPYDYVKAGLRVGEKHTIENLLYALLLPSANEAANVVAEHISGSVEAFATLCNKRAKELGCENLHFVNPNGIHDENHYCSAYDLYLIAKECRKHEEFNKIVKETSFTLPATDVYPYNDRTFKNTNKMLSFGTAYYYSNCTGMKTGYTDEAGQCFVGSSSYNGMDLISVVLNGKAQNALGLNERFYDTKRLFEFTYNNYSIKKIAEYGDKVATIMVGKATKDTKSLDVIVDTDISTIVPNDLNEEDIKKVIRINEDIIAPIEQNQVLGSISIQADGLVYTTNIIASHPVEKLPYTLYNTIVVVSLASIFVIFVVVLIISKKHRKITFVIELIIITVACVVLVPFIKKDIKNSITKILPAENVTLEENSTAEAEEAKVDEDKAYEGVSK